ncbi:MAG: MFS transporter [Cyanobacteria bacterium P01_D01_bin.105]
MRTFTLIWFGQLISATGSRMTFFSLTLWIWEATGSATALALVSLCFQLPQIPTTLFAGLIVDRYNRKSLMLLGDAAIAMATLVIGGLYLTGQLAVWHLYLVTLMAGGFGQIQILAYQASLSLIIPKQHYTRAGSMGAIVHYGSQIVGPALAGVLYPIIQLSGIIAIDLVTFVLAFTTLLLAHIPQPTKVISEGEAPSKGQSESQSEKQSETLLRRLTFGFRYVWQRPSLKALLLLTMLFTVAHDLGGAVQNPMILSRTGGSPVAVAGVSAAAGIGGVTGAIVVSLWGGPKRRTYGFLLGYIGAGLSKLSFGFGRSLSVWVPAQVCSSLNFPLLGSCRSALWMDKIASEIQGSVFAANSLVLQCASAVSTLLAGPLAEHLFEPAMMPGGWLTPFLGSLFGVGPGAGMAVLYALCSLALLLVGIGGFCWPQLRRLEKEDIQTHVAT